MLVSNNKVTLKLLLIFIILINVFSINSAAVVSQTREFYINDYANLINEDTEQYIINTNLNLYNQTGAQIVVVTVQSLEGKEIEEYATDLFRKFGIGNSKENSGVLMLLALEEREFRIEVGYGLEGVLTDANTGRIQDQYIIPYLSQNNWDTGIRNGYNAIIDVVANEYGVEVNSEAPIETSSFSIESLLPIIVIGIVFVTFVIAIRNGATVSMGPRYYRGYNYPEDRDFSGEVRNSRNNSSSSRASSKSTRISFGGGGSSGGGGSTRKF